MRLSAPNDKNAGKVRYLGEVKYLNVRLALSIEARRKNTGIDR
jgi:hypothetical protein